MKIILKLIQFIKLLKGKLQKRFVVFIFFIILSAIFWLLITLSEIHETSVLYPVKFTDIPKNFVLANDLPDKLFLRIKAKGYTLLSYKLRIKSPVEINVNKIQLRRYKKDSLLFYTTTLRIKTVIQQELRSNQNILEIVEVKPDTLFFHFTETINKILPVKPNISETNEMYEKQYTLNGKIYTEPDSIEVEGPKSILDTMKFVYTKQLSFIGLNDSVIKTVQLNRNQKIRFNKKNVILVIPVDKFTESSTTVQIKAINTPDSIVLKTFPSSVRITYTVTLSNFNNVSSETFYPFVDYNLIESSTTNKLKVFVTDLPEYIPSIRINPSNVEFLIEKK